MKRLHIGLILVLIFFACPFQNIFSQTIDTVYFNSKWQITPKSSATYYRYATIKVDSFWHYIGKVQDFYINGTMQMEGNYSITGDKDGLFSFYYPDGKLQAQGKFSKDMMWSFWDYYFANGNKKARVYYSGDESSFTIIDLFDSTGKQFVKGGTGKFDLLVSDYLNGKTYRLNGEFISGDREGSWKYSIKMSNGKEDLIHKEIYEHGIFKRGESYSLNTVDEYKHPRVFVSILNTTKLPITESFEVDNNVAESLTTQVVDSTKGNTRDSLGVLRKVEVEAAFPGGDKAWVQFLFRNLNSIDAVKDVPASLKSFKATVWVQFIVCTDGTVCDIETINDVFPSMKTEAERVIKLSGKWLPALQNGKPVKAFRKQPITFVYVED
ncbi:MAG TPA: hypothetical protein VKB95_10225 [Chitinophagaceae bacterium]|nr:hypothetical protein [Chitinophagaceae bacterium]